MPTTTVRSFIACLIATAGLACSTSLAARAADPEPATTPAASTTAEPTSAPATGEPAAATESASTEAKPKADAQPWLIEHTNYGGDIWTRPAMTGDWGGYRQKRMDKGVRLDISGTYTFQANVADNIPNNRVGSTAGLEVGLKIDTDKAGLWPGGLFSIRGEGNFGQSINLNSSMISVANTQALYPSPTPDEFLLPEVNYTQFLAPWIGFTIGKYSSRDSNEFAHDESEQFMNGSFVWNPILGTTCPLSTLGMGVVIIPVPWLMVTTLFMDPDGNAESPGFDTAFDGNMSIYQIFEFTVKPWGKPGHQRIGWTYSSRERVAFSQTDRALFEAIVLGDTSGLRRESDDWTVFYDFDQYLWNIDGDEHRGVGLFGRFGIGNNSVNPTQMTGSIGIGGRGMIPGRPNDRFGVGVYQIWLSDELPNVIQKRSQDETGFEAFYNIALTPWLQITPDIQVANPARERFDAPVLLGVRVKVIF